MFTDAMTAFEKAKDDYDRAGWEVKYIDRLIVQQAMGLAMLHFPTDPKLDRLRDLMEQRAKAIDLWELTARVMVDARKKKDEAFNG